MSLCSLSLLDDLCNDAFTQIMNNCVVMSSFGGFLFVHSNQCVILEQNQNLTTLSSFHQYIFANDWKYAS